MIKTVSSGNERTFEKEVNELIKEGYKVSSTSCIHSPETVDTCSYDRWMAILVKE